MATNLQIAIRGDVGAKAKEYARNKIGRLAKFAQAPVLFARVKLAVEPDPARDRPVIAQALFDIDGTPVRAHVAARDMQEAIDILEDRLRRRLEHLTEHRQALRKRGPQARHPHQWRHGDAPTHRPSYFDRSEDERRIAQRKTFAMHALSAAEAAEEMDRLDYDFHLFVCADTGEACVVSRRPDGRIGIASTGPLPPAGDWLVADPAPTSTLDETQAVAQLNLTDAPYVFFRDVKTGAGMVVYRRYDGHYGLITSKG